MNEMPDGPNEKQPVDRRTVLKGLACAAAAGAAATACSRERSAFIESLLQKRFHEMTRDELAAMLERLEKRYTAEFGKPVTVKATEAQKDVLFGYALDISRCVGCRRCVYGCVEENNQSRDPQVHWITVLEMEKRKGVDLHYARSDYDPEQVPEEGKFYFPVQCQQCANPPCVKVCPVKATWKDPDGIVLIDQDWCVGCRCCMTACPYGARHFNWKDPQIPAEELNPNMEYLGNRPRQRGVVEKCTFCVQRTRDGKYPKCVEVCPVGARKFGNLLDPDSEIRYIIDNKRVFILKESLNTQPKFFYYYG